MSYDSFCSCTPSEFQTVAEQWGAREERIFRAGWEQARFMAASMLQPYSKKALKPTDICRFSWDEERDADVPKGTSSREAFEKLVREREGQRRKKKQ